MATNSCRNNLIFRNRNPNNRGICNRNRNFKNRNGKLNSDSHYTTRLPHNSLNLNSFWYLITKIIDLQFQKLLFRNSFDGKTWKFLFKWVSEKMFLTMVMHLFGGNQIFSRKKPWEFLKIRSFLLRFVSSRVIPLDYKKFKKRITEILLSKKKLVMPVW